MPIESILSLSRTHQYKIHMLVRVVHVLHCTLLTFVVPCFMLKDRKTKYGDVHWIGNEVHVTESVFYIFLYITENPISTMDAANPSNRSAVDLLPCHHYFPLAPE